MKNHYVYGWHSTDGRRLFVYQKPDTWGVTERIADAAVFGSIQQCIDHYMSKHEFPEKYEESATNGYLFFVNQSTNQIKLF